MIVVGIDPGKDGGWAELRDGKLTHFCRLYTDRGIERMEALVWEHDAHVFIERAQPMAIDRPKSVTMCGSNNEDLRTVYVSEEKPRSARSMFTYGMMFGDILGRLIAFKIPHTLVRPADWTRAMVEGTKDDPDTKKRSLQAAQRLFPGASFIPPGCKRAQDGIYEAVLIGAYGVRKLKGEM